MSIFRYTCKIFVLTKTENNTQQTLNISVPINKCDRTN